MRKLAIVLLTAIFILTGCLSVFAGTWEAFGTDWKYKNDNGTYSAGTWQWIDGKCYCFGSNGIMYKDCTTPDGYKVNKDGAWIDDKGVVQVQQAATTAAASSIEQRLVYFNDKYGVKESDGAAVREWKTQWAPANIPNTLRELKTFLTSIDWPNMTEMQRLEACFKRIATGYCGNVYGYPSFMDSEMIVLVHKIGICKDYAQNMASLCILVGLEAYSEGRTYVGVGHEIIKVKVDGIWYVVDPTWAEGQPMANVMYRYDDPRVDQIYGASKGIDY